MCRTTSPVRRALPEWRRQESSYAARIVVIGECVTRALWRAEKMILDRRLIPDIKRPSTDSKTHASVETRPRVQSHPRFKTECARKAQTLDSGLPRKEREQFRGIQGRQCAKPNTVTAGVRPSRSQLGTSAPPLATARVLFRFRPSHCRTAPPALAGCLPHWWRPPPPLSTDTGSLVGAD